MKGLFKDMAEKAFLCPAVVLGCAAVVPLPYELYCPSTSGTFQTAVVPRFVPAPSTNGTTAGSTVGEEKPTDIPPVHDGTGIVLPPVLELNGPTVVPLPVTEVPLLELHVTSLVVPLSTSGQ